MRPFHEIREGAVRDMICDPLVSGRKVTIESPIELSAQTLSKLGFREMVGTNPDLLMFSTSPTFLILDGRLFLRIPRRFPIFKKGGNTVELRLVPHSSFTYKGSLHHPKFFVLLFGYLLAICAIFVVLGFVIALFAMTMLQGESRLLNLNIAGQFVTVSGIAFLGIAFPQFLSNVVESRAHLKRLLSHFDEHRVLLEV